MAKAKPIDLELMRQTFCYPSPEGKLYWLKTRGRKFKALDEAGSIDERGYVRVGISGETYAVHRIIFAMRHGIELSPDIEIDHIDKNPSNNRIDNLRLATTSQNMHNRAKSRNSTSGYKGAFWNKRDRKWRAQITLKNKQLHLGYFNTPEQAALAYNEAAKRLHGEFAYLNAIPDSPIENALGEKGVSNT